MLGQDASDDVLVDLNAEALGNDQRDARAAEARVAPFQLNDRAHKFFGRSLWTWSCSSARREELPVLPSNQPLMKAQQGRRPNDDGDTRQSACIHQKGGEPEQKPIDGPKAQGTPPVPIHDEELVPQHEVLRDDALDSAGSEHLQDGGQERGDEAEHNPHPRPVWASSIQRKCPVDCISTSNFGRA